LPCHSALLATKGIGRANEARFCGEDEENDAAEEFEQILECSGCREYAHPQCARDNDALKSDNDIKNWRCQNCVDHEDDDDDEEDESDEKPRARRRSSAPKATRELLPHSSDSHNVFDALILDDDPLDGSRALRKRKVSDVEPPQRDLRKRRRHSGRSTSAGAARSLSLSSNPDDDDTADGEIVVAGGSPPAEGVASRARSRSRRTRNPDRPLVSIESSGTYLKLVVVFNLDKDRLAQILTSKPRKNRGRERGRKKIPTAPIKEPDVPHYPAIPSSFSTNFFKYIEREENESKSKPYGGLLTEMEADTTKTFPMAADRKRFEDARQKAEEDWKHKVAAASSAGEHSKVSSKLTTAVSKIKCINFGGFEIDIWNISPYPEEYSRNKILYICEFCLKYMNSDYVAWRHKVSVLDMIFI
jgi:histone acetyltransferase SAS3